VSLAPLLLASAVLMLPAPLESKKSAYLRDKVEHPSLKPEHVATSAQKVVFARNLHTNEIMALDGPSVRPQAVDEFLRCWFTGKHVEIADGLAVRIVMAAHRFEAQEVHIVSGFRDPKYNRLLRKKGHEVAERSQHMEGKAVDFTLVGVGTLSLYRWLRQQHSGGVGYYPVSGFVHIDEGPRRTWRGR